MQQKDYAEVVGSTAKNFSGYLNGRAEFPLDVFMQIAQHEGINPIVLYYTDLEVGKDFEDLLREPDEKLGYKKQPGTIGQALTTIERLTGMLDDCMKERERLRGGVVVK